MVDSSSSSISITRIKSLFSVSCGATLFMILYMTMAFVNIYYLMYPLSRYDVSKYGDNKQMFVKPLWDPKSDMYMRVYLSTKSRFDIDFFHSDFVSYNDAGNNATNQLLNHALLWDEKLNSSSFSKSFLLTTSNCDNDVDNNDGIRSNNHLNTCDKDKSYKFAADWLDRVEKSAIERGEGGVLKTISSAGHGVESTSALLTLYEWSTNKISSIFQQSNVQTSSNDEQKSKHGILERKVLKLPIHSPLWVSLQGNSSLFLHVLLVKEESSTNSMKWPPTSPEEAMSTISNAYKSNSLLMDQVNMIKYESPHHVGKPTRILLNDLIYYWNKYIKYSKEMPPWVMEISKPEESLAYKQMLELKKNNAGYPYWKPEVSIKYINEHDSYYPYDLVRLSGMQIVTLAKKTTKHPTGIALMPAMHVDEMGLTSDKHIPVNETVTSLPIRISFDRNDLEDHIKRTTATAGGMSPARWRLLSHLSQAIESQKQLGFEQSDIDDVKRLIAETNTTLLTITMLASALHMLFEFLTFKSEVSFWRKNNDLTGLSVRSLFLDMIGQTIILVFLIQEESSLLTTIPSAIGCMIALWKCQRGFGLKFVRRGTRQLSWWNIIPGLIGYEIRATRLEARQNKTSTTSAEEKKDRLFALSLEADQIATRYLGSILIPLVLGYILYSFVYNEYTGWYSWIVKSAASAVYALGFVLMTPQLFLNWKLKSVAHLPWRVLVYKSLNTFIDDLFSFIIRMPTMARISCFRDDVVFFIYLYQRWLYPVDISRPVEGGDEMSSSNDDKSSTNDGQQQIKKDQ